MKIIAAIEDPLFLFSARLGCRYSQVSFSNNVPGPMFASRYSYGADCAVVAYRVDEIIRHHYTLL